MSNDRTRRRVLQLTGTALTAAVAGCMNTGGSSDDGEPTTNETAKPTTQQTAESGGNETKDAGASESMDIQPATGAIPNAPVPDSPSDHTYAVMGNADVTATLYGNWKCPHTEDFVSQQLPDIVTEYVEPGDLQVKFRTLAYRDGEPLLGKDAPRAARAGLAVWNADPKAYWQYFATVFANQPDEDRTWATTDRLMRFVESAGVKNQSTVKTKISGDAYADAIDKTTTEAAAVDVYSIPRVVVDGTVTAPTVDPEATREQLNEATK